MSEPAPQPESLVPAASASAAAAAPATPTRLRSPEDAPGAALEDAVGLALRVLQGITFALLVLFLGSGVFTVEGNEVAFVRRMGILDEEALGSGLHWRWQVLDEVVRVKKTSETVKALSFDLKRSVGSLKSGEESRKGGLDPEREGALLTGDSGLVHVSLALRYAPRAPFLRSQKRFRTEAPADHAHEGEDEEDDRKRALRMLLERSAVHAAAGRRVEGLLGAEKGEFLADVQRRTQDALDSLEGGIEVKGIDLESDLRAPPQVKAAFSEVTQSTQGVDKQRSAAKARASQIESQGLVEADRIQREAQAQAAAIRDESKALVLEFEALLEDYRRDPRAVRERILAVALAEAFVEVGEAFRVGEGELRIKLQRDTRSKRAALKADAKKRLLGE